MESNGVYAAARTYNWNPSQLPAITWIIQIYNECLHMSTQQCMREHLVLTSGFKGGLVKCVEIISSNITTVVNLKLIEKTLPNLWLILIAYTKDMCAGSINIVNVCINVKCIIFMFNYIILLSWHVLHPVCLYTMMDSWNIYKFYRYKCMPDLLT